MSQRASGYARKADEEYPTPIWCADVIGDYLRRQGLTHIWEPAAGHRAFATALREQGFSVTATTRDFFGFAEPPKNKLGGIDVQAIVTNPPYGDDRRGKLAADFVRHAVSFLGFQFGTAARADICCVAMLLRIDFDSAKTRVDLFRDNLRFAGKIVLLDRVKWFAGPSSPSENHAWYVWGRPVSQDRPPGIVYAGRADNE